MKKQEGITLITLIITIIIMLILAGVVINIAIGENGLIKIASNTAKKYKVEEIREKVDIAIANVIAKETALGNDITIEKVLQELLEDETFESIDEELGTGTIEDYNIKIKENEDGSIVVEGVEKATGLRITYTLDPKGYTNKERVSILFKVQGKVKSVKKPDGLMVYPQGNKIAIDYDVDKNGTYEFVIENEEGITITKNVIVDTIDRLAPKVFTITAENTGTGLIISSNVKDEEPDGISVKSGIDRVEYYLKKSTENSYKKYNTGNIENLEQGQYDIYAIAYDKAENPRQIEKITAEVIDPIIAMYGKNVNYSVTVNDIALDNWKVFYVDRETNDIFLIYGDYLPWDAVPVGPAVMKTSSTYPYRANWNRTSAPAMQTDWITNRELFGATQYTLNASINSSRYAATLLNTNNWVNFVDTNLADLAIGGPTLEMLSESLKEKGYISLNLSSNVYGYLINGSADYIKLNENPVKNDTLYFPRKGMVGGSRGYWLSAPGNGKSSYPELWNVYSSESGNFGLDLSNVGYTMSVRPIVHLKNGVTVKLNKETNKYDIIKK